VNNLARTICELTGWMPKKFEVKTGLVGSVNRRLADLSKIKKDVDWEPKTSVKKA